MRLRTILLAILVPLAGAALWSQAAGGVLYTYYWQGGWRWGRVEVLAPLRLDSSTTPARLLIDLPLVREKTDVYVVLEADTAPISIVLSETPVPESLRVSSMGLEQAPGMHYSLDPPRTVRWLADHSPTPGAVVNLSYRY